MPPIPSEQLAYWYLRLNGFLTIPNFIVHPDDGGNQRTDVDILGVRFPYRAELLANPMIDDAPFTGVADKPYIAIAEVKKGQCMLNGPWTNPKQENMHRVLRAVGAFPTADVSRVAASLYKSGVFAGSTHYVSLLCFGAQTSVEVGQRYPSVPQKLWPEVLDFIFERIQSYERQKASHPQWDSIGTLLYTEATKARERNEFRNRFSIQ